MATRGMNAAGRATRELLIATAEPLFAERGIDGVSLVQLGQVVDRRSPVVTQYYFGDKHGLIRAVHDRSADTVLARYNEVMGARLGRWTVPRSAAGSCCAATNPHVR